MHALCILVHPSSHQTGKRFPAVNEQTHEKLSQWPGDVDGTGIAISVPVE